MNIVTCIQETLTQHIEGAQRIEKLDNIQKHYSGAKLSGSPREQLMNSANNTRRANRASMLKFAAMQPVGSSSRGRFMNTARASNPKYKH